MIKKKPIFYLSIILFLLIISASCKSERITEADMKEMAEKYIGYTYMIEEYEFSDKITLDKALNYFIYNEIINSNNKYSTYIVKSESNGQTEYKLPIQLVDEYINKEFDNIDIEKTNKKNGDYYILTTEFTNCEYKYDYLKTENAVYSKNNCTFECSVFQSEEVKYKWQFTLINRGGVVKIASAIKKLENTVSELENFSKKDISINDLKNISRDFNDIFLNRNFNFNTNMPIKDALEYFKYLELGNYSDENDPYLQYRLPANDNELITYIIPKEIVNKYLLRHFTKIDFNNYESYDNDNYIFKADGIGSLDFYCDRIDNIVCKDNIILFDYIILSYNNEINTKVKFSICKKDGNILYNSYEVVNNH